MVTQSAGNGIVQSTIRIANIPKCFILWNSGSRRIILKIINEKNQLGKFLPGVDKITVGSSISELKIGEVFSIWSGMTSFRRTSTVEEIITPNLFITSNSVYFLKDQKFFIQQKREEKLNQIIND